MSNMSLPKYEEYEGFPQLENGVGLMRAFEYEIKEELQSIQDNIRLNKSYILATGTLAAGFMNYIKDCVMEKFDDLQLIVVPVKNNFFGTTITVSGLVTGQDLVEQLQFYDNVDGIIIPRSMLRQNSDVFFR